jgi:SagB-type dehydrogenase family enzyme
VSGATAQTSWSPLLSFRPHASQQLVVSDPLKRRRARIDAEALFDLLAASYRGVRPRVAASRLAQKLADLGWCPAGHLDRSTANKVKHWYTRGWHPSLQYYLWSRGRTQVDAKDATGEIRQQVVNEYLASGKPPRRTAGPGTAVAMPKPAPLPEGVTFGEMLMARRSVRTYARREVQLAVLSSILWHGLAGVRERQQLEPQSPLDYLRSYGIAFDFHIALFDVASISPGVYAYDIVNHRLVEHRQGSFRAEMTSILVGMRSPETASWTLVITADVPRYQWRYRHERALRHLYMASGRLGQRITLLGHAYGLGTVPTPAIRDSACCDLLGLDPLYDLPIYTLTMGPIPGTAATAR